MANPQEDFLEVTIKTLNKDQFDNLIKTFQKEYWKADEAIITDGTNDGGNDLRIYQGKTTIKKNVQITVQKLIETKIKEDIEKAYQNVIKYGYNNKLEFYYSQTISEKKRNEYIDYARDNFDINLEIFDARTLSQLNTKCIKEFIYSLHGQELKKNSSKVETDKKVLYDLLAIGNDTSDIKTNLLNSLIIFFVYNKKYAFIQEIQKDLQDKLDNTLDNTFILHQINNLRTKHRLISSSDDKSKVMLSPEENELVSDFVKQAEISENSFTNELRIILENYNIEEFFIEIFNYLKKLYETNYQLDIDENNNLLDYENKVHNIYNEFERFINDKIIEKNNVNLLINEIKRLCYNNDYINKIASTSSFTSLYKSNDLESYINSNNKKIYLDTPVLVFLLCYYYIPDSDLIQWDDPFYKAVVNLIVIQENNKKDISFSTTYGYINEAAAELRKGLMTASFFEYDFLNSLGQSKNSFLNFYLYLKEKNLLEKDICRFKDFINDMGFENINPESKNFISDTTNIIVEILQGLEIDVIYTNNYDDFSSIKKEYEILLLTNEKMKSNRAINNDVNAIRYISDKEEHSDNHYDRYFTTWDSSFYEFRKRILSTFREKLSFFHIYNPARLINKICLQKFNLKSDVITNDIFAYADANYNISSKVRNLIDIISPILGGKEVKKNIKLITFINKIRKQQIEDVKDDSYETDSKNVPIEEFFLKIIDYYNNEKSKYKIEDLKPIISKSEYNDFFIEKINTFFGSDRNKVDVIFKSIDELIELNKDDAN